MNVNANKLSKTKETYKVIRKNVIIKKKKKSI